MINFFDIFSALSFFFLPVLVGMPFQVIFNQKDRDHISFVYSFIYGSLVIFLQVALLNYLHTSNFTQYLAAILKGEVMLGVLIGMFYLVTKFKKIKIKRNSFAPIAVILVLSIVGFKIWSIKSPEGAVLNWDMFMHQAGVYEITKGGFNVNTTKIIDTFRFYSYTPIFHTIAFSSQLLFELDTDILNYWWYAQYFHFLFSIIASYILARKFTKSKTVGIFSATIGAFIFESAQAYTSLILIPQTLAAVIGMFVLADLIDKKNKGQKLIDANLIFALLFLILTHFIIGTALAGIIIFSLIYLRIEALPRKIKRILVLGAIIIAPTIYFASAGVNLGSFNQGEAQAFSLNFTQKINYFSEFYGYLAYAFFPIGLFFIFKEKSEAEIELAAILSIGTLALVFGNFPYILKLYSIGRFLVHVVMAYGAAKLVSGLSGWLKMALYTLLLATLISVFLINTYNFKRALYYNGEASHVKESEVLAAKFLAEKGYNKQPETVLLSDPTTMHIMEGLTGINTPGGAFTDTTTRDDLSKIFVSRDSTKMKTQLIEIGNKTTDNHISKILFVISGRFSKWQLSTESQRLGVVWNVWQPSDLTYNDYEFINFVDNQTDFKKLINSPEIVVYEITE